MLSTITGQSHTVVRIPAQGTPYVPFGWTVRVLLLVEDSGGEACPFWPLYDCMVAKWAYSDAWQANLARSVGLFWDFLIARRRVDPEELEMVVPTIALRPGDFESPVSSVG